MQDLVIDKASYKFLPFSFAKRHGVLLAKTSDGDLQLIAVEPGIAPSVLGELQRYVGLVAHYQELAQEDFNRILVQTYQNDGTNTRETVADIGENIDLASLAESVPESEDLLEQEDNAPIIRLINALLSEAVKTNASDIHIETFERRLIVRFRIDGMLQEIVQPKRQLAPLLVSRIKVMAQLDIAEKRLPQDGRISLRLAGREVDVRVSTLPAHDGERIVLRLLDKNASRLSLAHLGMPADMLRQMEELLSQPHGILLVTGPTGSGKTTTLYAGLIGINNRERNILSVEDPIEYNIEGIGQTQVNAKTGMTFARGLRAILRQDPDVVMIGEIRDLETAEIAVQASLTGHLVLSTLHTNSAVGALVRLQDMGIESFLLSSSLIGVLAQRLVRILCPDCKVSRPANEKECAILMIDAINPPEIFHPKGCPHCNHLGYHGRTGIYELIRIDESIRTLVHDQASEQEIIDQARAASPSIRQNGIDKVLAGITSIEEVLRVTRAQ
jgi:general secretion pathway protein E